MFAGLLRTLWRERGTLSAGFTLDKLLSHADQDLSQIGDLIPSVPESKPRTPFDSDPPLKKGPLGRFTAKQKLRALAKMVPLMASMERASRFYHGGFHATRSHASPALIAIFQGKGISCECAIVFAVEMDKEPMSTAPSADCQIEVPGEGARLRINTIYTNINNLPTLAEQGKQNEHLWVRDFCAMCTKCIKKFPVSAIYAQPQPRGDGGMQTIDHATCRTDFSENFGCAVCLVVCPFSQTSYEKVKANFRGNENAPQFRIPAGATG